MRTLVTGGAGFLGSHLCRRLLGDGHEVVCLDNFFTGRQRHIDALQDNANFEVIRHDVTEPISLEVDRVYNFACPASPVHYQANPVKTTKTNVMGMLHMLDLAQANGARVLQASTSEVYGDPEQHPQTEAYWGNVNPIGTRACYDEGKRVAETLCFDSARHSAVDVRVIRIFNTYGPHMLMDDGRVVSNFVVQALRGEDITLYGTGEQTRSFCYVDDLIEGVVRMMEQEDTQGPVNLGNPHEVTIVELAKRIIVLTGSASELVFRPLPADDPTRRKPDISRARTALDWAPKVTLDDGLKKTIQYFEDLLRDTKASE